MTGGRYKKNGTSARENVPLFLVSVGEKTNKLRRRALLGGGTSGVRVPKQGVAVGDKARRGKEWL
jgi:hypothetical protein